MAARHQMGETKEEGRGDYRSEAGPSEREAAEKRGTDAAGPLAYFAFTWWEALSRAQENLRPCCSTACRETLFSVRPSMQKVTLLWHERTKPCQMR